MSEVKKTERSSEIETTKKLLDYLNLVELLNIEEYKAYYLDRADIAIKKYYQLQKQKTITEECTK